MNKFLKLLFAFVVLFSIITFSNVTTFADDPDGSDTPEEDTFVAEAEQQVQRWINSLGNIRIERNMENDRYAFYPVLGTISNLSSYGLTYDNTRNLLSTRKWRKKS